MKISELPEELRELLELREKEFIARGGKPERKDSIGSRINFEKTPEGSSFWEDLRDDKDVTHYACYPKKKEITTFKFC